MNTLLNEPCLINTSQGFCVLYKEKYLYSKYNPSKNIKTIVQNLEILPGTLILAFSPLLCYGLEELIQKLPKDSQVLAVEFDENLLSFSKKYIQNLCEKYKNNFHLLSKNDILNFHNILQKKSPVLEDNFFLLPPGSFKRAISIDFSAGTQFYKNLYDQFLQISQNAISTFYKNRITLTKFSRKYCHNIFKNLVNFPDSVPISSLKNTILKPILILGTGSSVLETLYKIQNCTQKFFIISLDATLPILKSFKIRADLIISEECQNVIEKMFIGSEKCSPLAICAFTNAPNTVNFSAKNISYFISAFTDADFLKNLSKITNFPNFINPFGSVGLTAIYFSLYLRKNENVKIFFSGLDFSFDKNFTHAKGSTVYKNLFFEQTKLKPLNQFSSIFNQTNVKILSKNKNELFSTKALLNYANVFSIFRAEKNLFDIRNDGVFLGTKEGFLEFDQILKSDEQEQNQILIQQFSNEEKIKIKNEIKIFFENEIKNLTLAKDILTSKIELPETERNQTLTKILENREYLYLHFPDGYRFLLEISFLKRVRTELDFYLKEFKIDLKNLLQN